MRYALTFFLAFGAAAVLANTAEAGRFSRANRVNHYMSKDMPWHGQYAYTPYGAPTALVVPPVADTMTSYSWGVAQSEVRPLYHQFGRAYVGPGGGINGYRPTPQWPSHTDQFGVYPVRGPWR